MYSRLGNVLTGGRLLELNFRADYCVLKFQHKLHVVITILSAWSVPDSESVIVNLYMTRVQEDEGLQLHTSILQ